jgi:hypothetical protein
MIMHISMAFIFIYWEVTSLITLPVTKQLSLCLMELDSIPSKGKVLFLVYSVLTGCTAYIASQMEKWRIITSG